MIARIEGTGIREPSKEANKRMAAVYKPTKKDPFDAINTFLNNKIKEPGEKYAPGLDPDDPYKFNRGAFFSPDGGAYKDVQVASADLGSLDVGDSFTGQADKNIASASTATDEGFNKFIQKDFGVSTDSRTYKSFPDHIKGDLKNQYRDSLKFQEGTQINQAPVKKPSFIEQTKNFAGSIFNTVTGTQPAAASEIPGGMPSGTQFTSSNLDAAKASTGDTSFASYRMAGQPSAVEQKQQSETVVTPTVKPKYEINRTENRPSVGGTAGTGDTSFSAYVRGGGEGQQRGIVSPTSTDAPRQTVASLPSDYKQTEAREFAKAAAFQQAKKNPNVTTSIDSKGQVTVKPVQKTRADSGASANTAEGNQARVKQNAVARAQAAAINRKISGKSISQVKAANRQAMRDRAEARNETFKKTKKSTVSARRAAAKKANQAAAKKRHASFKKKRAEKKAAKKAAARAKARANARKRQQRRRRGRRRRCDIRCKYNIMPLTNMNLIRDDLAEVAYFVKKLQA